MIGLGVAYSIVQLLKTAITTCELLSLVKERSVYLAEAIHNYENKPVSLFRFCWRF